MFQDQSVTYTSSFITNAKQISMSLGLITNKSHIFFCELFCLRNSNITSLLCKIFFLLKFQFAKTEKVRLPAVYKSLL